MYKSLVLFLESKNIEETKIKTICSFFKLKKTNRNQILVDYNEVCQHYYFVNKGCLRIFTINKEGLENSRYFAFEGNFGTALPSFIDQKPALEYLQAIEKSELLVITRHDFYFLVHSIPEFSAIYREILELGFINAQQRIYGFQGLDALEKVSWTIKNNPKLLLRVSNKMAASYLGMSPSTLSRMKSKL
ncbi:MULTISPECIES: Crp/Fnr family transcriptional regulator [Flavobacteriaceae]|uniref:Crp/Fnr family transcriptional regulator n=2 Tax=Flavobacteriaceae TaxID=49546 RepID=A0A4Y8AW51_9FLAO|nr:MULTISPECIES: Crp/Fnr family transcriptional regulator [Flavobacteriaceae]TEW76719.1 Crp/Fnr family transcriptional regulator [Gramella jeungdoensis]GGK50622.1 hypothetical protein GCM10007963_18720 [Lutibacter litoralis]